MEAFNVWKSNHWESTELIDEPLIDLEQLITGLPMSSVGPFYYYIFNFKQFDFEFVSQDVQQVLGYTTDDFHIEFALGRIHPEDVNAFVNFENAAGKFLLSLPKEKVGKYKVRMDFRALKANGDIVRLLSTVMPVQLYRNGNIFRTLGIHTDITSIKPFGKPTLSFMGMDGEPSYFDVAIDHPWINTKELLTKKEKQILKFITEGKISKEISDLLHIEKNTVDRHRKNMLRKSNCSTIQELILVSIRNGWI